MNTLIAVFRFLLALLCLVPGAVVYCVSYFISAMFFMARLGWKHSAGRTAKDQSHARPNP